MDRQHGKTEKNCRRISVTRQSKIIVLMPLKIILGFLRDGVPLKFNLKTWRTFCLPARIERA
jgi:hypothetical protein